LVDGANILEEITVAMFTAELHHLGTYISQPITLKHGVINEKITNIHHCKNLYPVYIQLSPPAEQNEGCREKNHT